MARVRVRRERPTAVALAIALCVTMLVVYVLTLDMKGPDVVESMAAAPRVTRQVVLEPLEAWCVCMATCETQQDARLQASAWVGRGAADCVTELDGGWAVLGAMYDSKQEAERVASRLDDDAGIPAGVVSLDAEGVTLRVTAPEAQIDAIVEADAMLRDQSRQMGQIALQLDRDEIGAEAARTLCGLAGGEAGDAAARLSAIPGAPENELCAGLIERLNALADMLGIVAKSPSGGAALSGMLRCAQIENHVGQRALMKGLGNRD